MSGLRNLVIGASMLALVAPATHAQTVDFSSQSKGPEIVFEKADPGSYTVEEAPPIPNGKTMSVEALEKAARALHPRTQSGEPVIEWLVRKDADVMIGTNGTARIEKVSGEKIVVSFIDPAGNPRISVSPADVVVIDTAGKPVAFSITDLQKTSLRVSYRLLLDDSGSIKGAVPQLHAKASAFVKQVGAGADCSVSAFAGTRRQLASGKCNSANITKAIHTISGDGGSTHLVEAMRQEISAANASLDDDTVTAVVLASDGQHNGTQQLADLEALKADIAIYTMFVTEEPTSQPPELLQRLSTALVSGGGDVFGRLLDHVRARYGATKVITLNRGNGGGK